MIQLSFETVTVLSGLLVILLAVLISNWAMVRSFRNESKLRRELSGLRGEWKADIAELRAELRAQIATDREVTQSRRAELKADIAELREDTMAQISTLSGEVKSMNHRIDATNFQLQN